MKTTKTAVFVRAIAVLAVSLGSLATGCVVHTGRRADVVYVGHPHGGGPVHGAMHGVHCIEHAATLRGCD